MSPDRSNQQPPLAETPAAPVPATFLRRWLWPLAGLLACLCGTAVLAVAVATTSGEIGGFPFFSPATSTRTMTGTAVAATVTAEVVGTPLPATTSEPTAAPSTPPWPQATPLPGAMPSPIPLSGPMSGRIVFDRVWDGPPEIFIMNADGSDLLRLTHNNNDDAEADLSPESRFIAYETRSGGEWELALMTAAGQDKTVLGPGRRPDWSPDGLRIAYETLDDAPQIGIVDLTTGATALLTDGRRAYRAPSWSPDGRELVVMSAVDGVWQLVILDVATGAERAVTRGSPNKRFPAWSPDGSLIAYEAPTNGDGASQIWVIEPSGANPRQLTFAGHNSRPTWSPDGQYLLFSSDAGGASLIYRISRDGSEQTSITSVGRDSRPDWRP